MVKHIQAVRRIPKLIEAKESNEKETLLDPVSSDEEFFREHLNRSFKIKEVERNNISSDANPNLIAIATCEQSATNSADKARQVMRSTESNNSSLNKYSRNKC